MNCLEQLKLNQNFANVQFDVSPFNIIFSCYNPQRLTIFNQNLIY